GSVGRGDERGPVHPGERGRRLPEAGALLEETQEARGAVLADAIEEEARVQVALVIARELLLELREADERHLRGPPGEDARDALLADAGEHLGEPLVEPARHRGRVISE